MALTYKIAQLIKSLRIKEWRVYVGLSLFGLAFGSSDFFIFIKGLFKLIPLIFFYMSIAYLTNNIFDADGDSLNLRKRDKNPFAQKLLKAREGLLFLAVLVSSAIILALLIYDLAGLINYLIGLFLVIFYSTPPLRFKEKPFIDLLSHSLFFGVTIFLLGYFIVSRDIFVDAFLLLGIVVYSIQLELRNEIEDFHADFSAGYKTTAVYLGFKKSNVLLIIISSLLVIISILVLKNQGVSFLLSLIPLVLIPAFSTAKIEYNVRMRIIDAYVIIFSLLILLLKHSIFWQ